MTKKHYKSIAEIINKSHSRNSLRFLDSDALPNHEVYTEEILRDLIDDLCLYFKTENINFQIDKFKTACGYRSPS